MFFRSLLFNIAFIVNTSLHIVFGLPFLVSEKSTLRVAHYWSVTTMWLARVILNLTFEVRGKENLPNEPSIVACKHQSAWETVVFFSLFPNLAIVLKKELLRIPFFNMYVKRTGTIYVDRGSGFAAMKSLIEKAKKAIDQDKWILIFPEGTRSPAGKRGEHRPGVGAMYSALKVPVVPVALNSGVFWPRRSFLKKSGKITLEYLPPIKPGLGRKEFMETFEKNIEERSLELYNETKPN